MSLAATPTDTSPAEPVSWTAHAGALARAAVVGLLTALGRVILLALVLVPLAAWIAAEGSMFAGATGAIVALVACGVIALPLAMHEMIARASLTAITRFRLSQRIFALVFDRLLTSRCETTDTSPAAPTDAPSSSNRALLEINQARVNLRACIDYLDHQRTHAGSWPKRLVARLVRHKILAQVERLALRQILLEGADDGRIDLIQLRDHLADQVDMQVTDGIRSATRRSRLLAIALASGAAVACAWLIRMHVLLPGLY